eukprot:1161608-Pelagomonas_calceolata.AAC.14
MGEEEGEEWGTGKSRGGCMYMQYSKACKNTQKPADLVKSSRVHYTESEGAHTHTSAHTHTLRQQQQLKANHYKKRILFDTFGERKLRRQ